MIEQTQMDDATAQAYNLNFNIMISYYDVKDKSKILDRSNSAVSLKQHPLSDQDPSFLGYGATNINMNHNMRYSMPDENINASQNDIQQMMLSIPHQTQDNYYQHQQFNNSQIQLQQNLDQNMLGYMNDSMQTVQNLKLLKTEDAEKLLTMDKSEIIKYYESLLDKCHEALIDKRDSVRSLKEQKLSLQFTVSRFQRSNLELKAQVEQLKRDFSGRLIIIQREKDALQQQFMAKEALLKQYQQAFEDLKGKNYQLENVAFTYHMTVQRLKEREIDLSQKNEELQELNMKIDNALRMKHEDCYQIARDKDVLLGDIRKLEDIQESLKMDSDQLRIQRDLAEQDIDSLKQKIGELELKLLKLQNENQRLSRDTFRTSRSNNAGVRFNDNLNITNKLDIEDLKQEESQQQVQWLSSSQNRNQGRNTLEIPAQRENLRHTFTEQQNKQHTSFYNDFNRTIKRGEVSQESNPFNKALSQSPIRQKPQAFNSVYPSKDVSNFQIEQDQEPQFKTNDFKQRNDRSANTQLGYKTGNDHNENSYQLNKKRQEASQLGGVFNWGANDSSPINIRNLADDYRRNTVPSKSYMNSPVRKSDENIDEDENHSIYQTPQRIEKVRARKSCSYMGIGERDIEDNSGMKTHQQPTINMFGTQSSPQRNQLNNYKRGGDNFTHVQLMNQKLNQELTKLQIEKQKIEGDFSKLKFSQISTKHDVKIKKDMLENEIIGIDTQINKLRQSIRELKNDK
eukprot:403365937